MLQRKWWRRKKTQRKQKQTNNETTKGCPRGEWGKWLIGLSAKPTTTTKHFDQACVSTAIKAQKQNETKQAWPIRHIDQTDYFIRGSDIVVASFKLAAWNHHTIKGYYLLLWISLRSLSGRLWEYICWYFRRDLTCHLSLLILFLFLLCKQPALHLWWKELFISWWQWPRK